MCRWRSAYRPHKWKNCSFCATYQMIHISTLPLPNLQNRNLIKIHQITGVNVFLPGFSDLWAVFHERKYFRFFVESLVLMLYAHCTFVFVFEFFVFWEMCTFCNVMLVKLLMQFFALLLWDISALQPNTFNLGRSGFFCDHFWFVPAAWISVFQIFCCKYCFCPPFCCGVPQYMRF